MAVCTLIRLKMNKIFVNTSILLHPPRCTIKKVTITVSIIYSSPTAVQNDLRLVWPGHDAGILDQLTCQFAVARFIEPPERQSCKSASISL